MTISINNKVPALFLSTFLVSMATYAQPVQFLNGDTLDVELIQQTDTTLTFLHAVLGRQTIDKAKISNLHELDLVNLVKVPGGEEGIALEKVRVAEEKVLSARQEVNSAKEKALGTENNVKIVTGVDAELQSITAGAELEAAEEQLTAALGSVSDAKDEVKMAKEVKNASAQVSLAKSEAAIVRGKFRLAENKIKTAQQNIVIAEQAEKNADGAGVSLAEAKVDQAEELLDIAEDQMELAEDDVNTANEKIQAAENNVKLAKGEKVNDGFMGTGWFKDWDSSIEIGLKGSKGSSVNSNFRTAFNARYEDTQHRWDFKTFYLVDSKEKKANENQVNATLVKDWFFPETRWFAFASATYDWDEFKDWDHRLQIAAGPGYQFIKTKEWEFSGRIGGTGVFEFGKTVGGIKEDTSNFDALIGADLIWYINAMQRFSFSNYVYTGITDPGEYRNLTTIDWTHDISWFEGLAIKFGIRNEYDTSESTKNEFKYNFSLLWGF